MRKRIALIVTFVAIPLLVSCATSPGKQPFSELVKTGTPRQVQAAIDSGANVNGGDSRNETPLMYASWFTRNPAVIILLLKAGADVNARNSNGDTALIRAMFNNNPAVVSLLLKAGADVNAANNDGNTPLIQAAVNQNSSVISLLLEAGADGTVKNKKGKTALDVAKLHVDAGHQDPAVYKQLAAVAAQSAATGSLEIRELSFDDIYPVFHTYYDTHPLGTVVLANTSGQSITGITVTFQIKEFMADPKSCPAPSVLRPQQSMSVDLLGLFLPTILQTTEKTKTQARVDVEYTLNDHVQHENRVQSISILNRSATSWVDDRRAAAFVTIRDPVVLAFSKNVNSIVKGRIQGDPNLVTAVALFQTLQLYGLTYSQDPLPTLTSSKQVADFIQFPRETLQYKGGKCSDFSVLFSALLESVGIETAFITIPGHIFLAFSTGAGPDEARRIFSSRADDLIFRAGKSWIPVEVTETAGFLQAWQDGAREWRASGSQAAFYPLHDAWQLYEPVALPGTAVAVDLPSSEKIVSASQKEVGKFVDQEISAKVAVLESQITKGQDPRRPINTLGVLYARYGLYERAQKEFEKLLAKEEYVPALLNMGNILYLSDQKGKALDFYMRAYARDPENPRVLLGVARVNYEFENYGVVKKLYAELKTRDPDLARQYAYLNLQGDDATRSANAAAMRLLWEESP